MLTLSGNKLAIFKIGRLNIPFPFLVIVASLAFTFFYANRNTWAAGLVVPSSPRAPRISHGARLIIKSPGRIVSGEKVEARITVVNHGKSFLLIPGLLPPEYDFPSSWCWGPNVPSIPTVLLRNITYDYGRHPAGSEKGSGAMPGHQYTLHLPLNFAHIFDLTVPGKYRAQLAGMGMDSNVNRFRVLPPRDKPRGPAVREFSGKLPRRFAWGSGWHGVQMAAYVKGNPGIANPTASVRILFRRAGRQAAAISLTGNPHIDFARRKMIGPFHTIKAIDGKPAPPTAYGRLLAYHRQLPAAAKTYRLKPGVIYTYWRPLVLNREFDLSVYGPYEFSAHLGRAKLKTDPVIIYVGVQSRFYRRPKIHR